MAKRIYTRTGDQGETGLYRGGRVRKDHFRVETYGTVDELNACLGWARSLGLDPAVERTMARIQSTLFELSADLATPPAVERRPDGVTPSDVEWLEQEIDRASRELPEQRGFILPGGAPAAAVLHLACTVCRRAERRAVTLCRREPETASINLCFLNRLSDLLFVLARLENHQRGGRDVAWVSRAKSVAGV